MFRVILAAMVWAGSMSSAAALIDSYRDIDQIREATPSCEQHRSAPIVGRVSGNTTGILDQVLRVSFVGCFNSMRVCERWRGQASRIIDSTIIQYSCTRR